MSTLDQQAWDRLVLRAERRVRDAKKYRNTIYLTMAAPVGVIALGAALAATVDPGWTALSVFTFVFSIIVLSFNYERVLYAGKRVRNALDTLEDMRIEYKHATRTRKEV